MTKTILKQQPNDMKKVQRHLRIMDSRKKKDSNASIEIHIVGKKTALIKFKKKKLAVS